MKQIPRSPFQFVEDSPSTFVGDSRSLQDAKCALGPALGMMSWFGSEGHPLPPGQSWVERDQAYNFSLFAENAETVTLLLYGEDDPATPIFSLSLEPRVHKLRSLWFCKIAKQAVPGARYYAYSVSGPSPGGPNVRHAFDPDKVLLDPYARSVWFPPAFDRDAARRTGSNAGKAPLGVLIEAESPIECRDAVPVAKSPVIIVYELHVSGFTKSPSSGLAPELRGTFRGIIEKIPYLKELGVTRVELMPIHQFDPKEGNYWGYMTLNFFAVHRQYAADQQQAKEEFLAMVRALHAEEIEVILDVVYNHTTEEDENGPNYSFKGIDNSTYYILTDDPKAPYANYSGTGNTLRCGNKAVRVLILESLRYWAQEMEVDGFRFDLASVFTRRDDGSVDLTDSPLVTAIRSDPILRYVHLIAEPWDAAGAYELGIHFPGQFWSQWNGQFRDDIRRFVKGDLGMVPTMMRRLYGSDDLFPDTVRDACRPFHSINYVNSHDGFTLYDLVSYNERRNQANGHDNTDGTQDNYSWNCGWEGDEGAPAEVLKLRKQQAKNFCCLLFLANGIPMFRAGDEFLQTQGGNNNPYNQDNATSWLNWSRAQVHVDVLRFFRLMIAFRKARPSLCRTMFWRDDVRWYGVGPSVDMSESSHAFAYCLRGASHHDYDLYVMINAYWEPLIFTIQEGVSGQWRRVVDTAQASPDDIVEEGKEPVVGSAVYEVQARSVVVLRRGERQSI